MGFLKQLKMKEVTNVKVRNVKVRNGMVASQIEQLIKILYLEYLLTKNSKPSIL